MKLLPVLLAATLLACSRDTPRPAPANHVGATVEAIVEKPQAYLGLTVTVSGEIERIHGKRAFTLGGSDFVFDKELLVVTPHDFRNVADHAGGLGLNKDDIVQVTGEVRSLPVAEVEREIGWDLSPELEVELASRPVLVARGMLSTPRKQPLSVAVGGGPDLAIVDPIADVAILVDAPPPSVLGKDVFLDAITVQSVVGERGVFVGPSHGHQVFVALPSARKDLAVGDKLDVKGRVEAPPRAAAAKEQFGVDSTVATLIAAEPNIVRAEMVVKE